jgi:hypothetical protein
MRNVQGLRASRASRVQTLGTIAFLMVVGGVPSCGGSDSAPTASPSPTPSPTPPSPAPVQLAVFSDPASSFSTSDVRDVEDVAEEIVQFDVANNALIWKANGQSFPGYPVSGNFVASDQHFQILFGTKDGQRRAYFTETASATICDIAMSGGQLSISPTNVTVPGGG